MTTSGTITASMTARQLCEAAARDLGVYSAGESLNAADAADMLVRLQWMLKSWQADGCNLWRETEGTVTFDADEATMTLDPRCIDVMEARYVQTSTFERPLQRFETGEYKAIPNKAQGGFPVVFYLQKQVASVTMTLWPVPSEETEIAYTYARVIEDVTDLGQTIDVPQEWMETLWTGLAKRCASLFGVTRLDPAAVALVTARANQLEQKLMDHDRPASVFMGNIHTRNF